MKKLTGIIFFLFINFLLFKFSTSLVYASTITITPDRFYSINRTGNNTATPAFLGRWDDNGNWSKWLSHWDFSAIPAGSTITSVELLANQTGWVSGGSYAYVFRVMPGNENWTSAATWTTKDGVTPWVGSAGLGIPDIDYYSTPLGLVYTPSGDYSVSLDPVLFQNVIDNNESLLFTALDNLNAWDTSPLISNPSVYEELIINYSLLPIPTPTPTPIPTPTPTPPSGIVDYAVNFNTSGYLETSTPLTIGSSFSIEFTWQDPWPHNPNTPYNVVGPNYFTSATGGVGLFELEGSSNGGQSNQPILYGGITWNGRMFLYDNDINGYTYSAPVPYAWNQGQIYHLYFARDTNGTLYFGQNGKILSVQRNPHTGGTGYFYLGTGYTGRSLGIINEFRLLNSVLYKTNYDPSTYFTPDSSTILLAHMDEGIGTTTADSSGNGNTFDFKGDSSWILAPTINPPPTPTPTPTPIAPTVQPISGATIMEGDTYSTTGSFTDPDSGSWTATVDYGDGSGIQSLSLTGTTFTLSHQYKDEGSYVLTVSVTDDQGLTGTATITVIVVNAPFTVSTITAPTSPVQVNTPIMASASFTDPGVLDTHTASWDWGDGTTTGTVTENNGSGSVNNTHTYTTAGVYTVILTVTDDDGLSVVSQPFQYVVVYNPTGGFLTASGKYNSLTGWDIQNAQATGEVKFGVSAQYAVGSTTPSGQSKLRFKAGGLDFSSTSFQWLVVSGAKAILKGNGMVNGTGTYTFLFSGIDGSQNGGQSLMRFQIMDSSSTVIYDTQLGGSDTADPTTPLTSGSIKVH